MTHSKAKYILEINSNHGICVYVVVIEYENDILCCLD